MKAGRASRSEFGKAMIEIGKAMIEIGGGVEKSMKVYLDNERATPPSWVRVYLPYQAIALLEAGGVANISVDHDLWDDD